jgi:hypothetical protein
MFLYPGTLYQMIAVLINFYKERGTLYRLLTPDGVFGAAHQKIYSNTRTQGGKVQRTAILTHCLFPLRFLKIFPTDFSINSSTIEEGILSKLPAKKDCEAVQCL